jgi:phage gp37-like protein
VIGLIEAAIVERLASSAPFLDYGLSAAAATEGQFSTAEGIAQVVSGLPGAWVRYQGSGDGPKQMGAARWRIEARFSVLVAAGASRQSGGDVGSYRLSSDVIALLLGQRLGLDISAFSLLAVSLVPTAPLAQSPVSVLSVDFSTSFVVGALADALSASLADQVAAFAGQADGLSLAMAQAAEIGDLASSANTWAVRKHATVLGNPAGSGPVTDTITLETGS